MTNKPNFPNVLIYGVEVGGSLWVKLWESVILLWKIYKVFPNINYKANNFLYWSWNYWKGWGKLGEKEGNTSQFIWLSFQASFQNTLHHCWPVEFMAYLCSNISSPLSIKIGLSCWTKRYSIFISISTTGKPKHFGMRQRYLKFSHSLRQSRTQIISPLKICLISNINMKQVISKDRSRRRHNLNIISPD